MRSRFFKWVGSRQQVISWNKCIIKLFEINKYLLKPENIENPEYMEYIENTDLQVCIVKFHGNILCLNHLERDGAPSRRDPDWIRFELKAP